MSTDLESELRAAFEAASESIMPGADLAGRIRRAVRRRRRTTAVLAAVLLAAGAYLTGSLAAGRLLPPHPSGGHDTVTRGVIVRPSLGQEVDALAVAGPYLYVTTDHGGDPPYALSAYNRATGRLIRQVRVPAVPAAVQAGPDNSVWLTLYPNQNGGPCAIWLFTADLRLRSVASRICTLALLPTGPVTALTAVENGELATLTMPPPGGPGRASYMPYANVGHYAVVSLTPAGSRVAALVTNDFGDYHLVLANQPGPRFGNGTRQLIDSVAGQAGGWWVTTTRDNSSDGPLVRLSATLRPVTPVAIDQNPVLQRSEHVWSHANTIWVATASAGHPLVCFTDRAGLGTIATVPVRGQPAALAFAGHNVYITLATAPDGAHVAYVFAYPIPPECG